MGTTPGGFPATGRPVAARRGKTDRTPDLREIADCRSSRLSGAADRPWRPARRSAEQTRQQLDVITVIHRHRRANARDPPTVEMPSAIQAATGSINRRVNVIRSRQ